MKLRPLFNQQTASASRPAALGRASRARKEDLVDHPDSREYSRNL